MRTMGKNMIAVVLSIVLCFACVPGAAFANERPPSEEIASVVTSVATEEGSDTELLSGTFECEPWKDLGRLDAASGFSGIELFSLDSQGTDKVALAESILREAAESYQTTVDNLVEYGISVGQMTQAFYQLVDDPELFYLSSRIGYSYTNDAETQDECTVVRVRLEYVVSQAELPAYLDRFNKAIGKALSWVGGSMTDVQKVQVIHDYLVRSCAYDEETFNSDTPAREPHSAYGALVNGLAVCQGYANAYKLLLQRLGIPCVNTSSQPMNHMWNMVQLEGAWYHVDVTWDDPIPDGGFDRAVSHRFFLRSDNSMSSMEHYGWVTSYLAPNDYSLSNYPEYTGPYTPSEPSCPDGHAFTNYVVIRAATCTEDGLEKAVCGRCGAEDTRAIAALGHDFSSEWTVDAAPTCTVEGSQSRHCSRCDEVCDVVVLPKTEHVWDSGVVTTEPTTTTTGIKTYTCLICQEEKREDIPRLPQETISFGDVTSSTPHADDILWLASSGISEGWLEADGARTFRGMSGVVRQDMAAFLYRLAGSPAYEPTAADRAKFSDVDETTPHAKEIWWLASTGISEGWLEADGTRTFRGMSTVVRQDMAAFLYRLAGSPSYQPTAADRARFSDVNKDTPHAKEIWWLASAGISEGWTEPDNTRTFRGMSTVVRQDMAAFLHRMSDKGLV